MTALAHRSFMRVVAGMLVVALLAGCSGSDDSGSRTEDLVTTTIYGQVDGGGLPLDGMAVGVFGEDDSSVVDGLTLTDASGAFAVTVTAPAARPLVIMAVLPGGAVLRADVAEYDPEDFVYVSALTSVTHAFRKSHPELSVDAAQARVFDAFGVPPEWRLGDEPVNAELSQVSGEAIMAMAAGDPGGFDGTLRTLVAAIDAGKSLSIPGDGPTSGAGWDGELNNRVVESRTPGVKAGKDATASFAGGVSGTSLATNAAAVVLKAIAYYRDEMERAKVDAALTRIETSLETLKAELRVLALWVKTRFDQSDYTVLSNLLNPHITQIGTAYEKVLDATRHASSTPKNLTDLDASIQGLYQFSPTAIYEAARNVHLTQWGKDPLAGSLIGYARKLSGADRINSPTSQAAFANQVETHAGYQAQAVAVIASLGQPGFRRNSADFSDLSYTFPSSDAGQRNQAAENIRVIVDNIQQQRSMLPLPLANTSQMHDVATNAVYGRGSVDLGSGGKTYDYVRKYNAGGLSNWTFSDRKALGELLRSFNGSKGLNERFGFDLRPSRVTYLLQHWERILVCTVVQHQAVCNWKIIGWGSSGTKVATERGFLTVDVMPNGKAEIGWVDDSGFKDGRIGETYFGDLAAALDSSRSVYVSTESSPVQYRENWVGRITGPVVAQQRLAAQDVASPAIAAALGMYAKLDVAQDPKREFVADVLSGGSSGTEGLKAQSVPLAGSPSKVGQDLTGEVYWEAMNPATGEPIPPSVATVSNLRVPKEAPSPQYAMARHDIGTVHWMPDSRGRKVTFRASRYLPNGSRVAAEITLDSPVTAAAAAPDALDLFPPQMRTTTRRLAGSGIQLYATRHWPRGWFEDATNAIAYTSSHPAIVVSATGLVQLKPAAQVEPGTTVTITATDPAIEPQAGIATRKTAVAEFVVD